MEKGTKQIIIWFLIILSVCGLGLSAYLTYEHYVLLSGASQGTFCDLSETLSCSGVNTSSYSEMFNVPVSVFGALWFVFFLFMCFAALKKNGLNIALNLIWAAFGFGFVFYLVYAEFMLRTICLLCTAVHIILLIILITSIYLYRQEKKLNKEALKKLAVKWVIAIGIVYLITLGLFNVNFFAKEKKDYTDLAKCLTEKGLREYGSYVCASCKAEKKALGDAFQFIDYVECHPRGPNPQVDLCLEKDIDHTPTWILEPNGVEQKRVDGFQGPENLAKFAGCESELVSIS